jgi:hypothetical protein
VLLARAGRYNEASELFAEIVASRPGLLHFVRGLAPLGFLQERALAALTSRVQEPA